MNILFREWLLLIDGNINKLIVAGAVVIIILTTMEKI